MFRQKRFLSRRGARGNTPAILCVPSGLSPIDCRARRVSDTPGGEWRVLLLQKDKTMAETKKLAATVRGGTGKGAARSTRREGRTPAVLYGGGEAPTPLSLDTRTVTKLIFAGHFLTTIFELEVDGKTERAIPRDYQLDVVKDHPIHVDFLRLKPGSRLRLEVPVHFINHEAAPGIKRGGALNVVYHSIELWVPADNIPEAITADLTGLDFNDSLHISAIPLPQGSRPTNPDKNFTVASITPPLVVAEEPAAAGAAPAAAGKGAAGKAAPAAKAAPAPRGQGSGRQEVIVNAPLPPRAGEGFFAAQPRARAARFSFGPHWSRRRCCSLSDLAILAGNTPRTVTTSASWPLRPSPESTAFPRRAPNFRAFCAKGRSAASASCCSSRKPI